jgi:hypothetical protein
MAEDTLSGEKDSTGPEELDVVAGRLEAALARIGQHLDGARAARPTASVAARLDGLIARLRGVLEHGGTD